MIAQTAIAVPRRWAGRARPSTSSMTAAVASSPWPSAPALSQSYSAVQGGQEPVQSKSSVQLLPRPKPAVKAPAVPSRLASPNAMAAGTQIVQRFHLLSALDASVMLPCWPSRPAPRLSPDTQAESVPSRPSRQVPDLARRQNARAGRTTEAGAAADGVSGLAYLRGGPNRDSPSLPP